MADAKGWSSSDWYQSGEGQLHFFPYQKRIIWTVGKQILANGEAWGGSAPVPGVFYPTMKPRPTTPGTYVIQSFGPYRTRTWPMSRIPWGTPIRVAGGRLLFEVGVGSNSWRPVDSLIPGLTIHEIREDYAALYGDSRIYDPSGGGIPDRWVFNDFGPWAVRYFLDPNRNRRLDRGESLMGEMLHTTPEDEAATKRGKEVHMANSHGCIHIRPVDRNRFKDAGAFEKGNLLVVHTPNEVVPEFLAR